MNMNAPPKTDIVNTLVQTVKQDVELLEKSGQWAFSSYSPAKECASIPGIGLDDISPEEMRFEAYTAKYSNTLPAFQQTMQGLVQTYANIRQQLLNPSPSIKEALRKLYKDDSQQNKSVFGGGFGAPQSSGGLFGGSSSGNSGGLFGGGGGGNTFGGSPAGNSGKSMFGGGSLNQQGSSLFGGSATNTVQPQQGGSIFGGSATTNPQQQTGSVFGAPSSTNNPFASFQQKPPSQSSGASIFSSNPPPNASQGIFSSPQSSSANNLNINNNNNVFGQAPMGGGIFSNSAPNVASSVGLFGGTALATTGNSSEAEGMNEEVIQEAATTPAGAAPILGSNIFQPSPVASNEASVKTGLFGQVLKSAEDPSIYSKVEELSHDTLQVFKSRAYVLGNIPEVPPPRELCV